jgi:D-lactate dehydrogenase
MKLFIFSARQPDYAVIKQWSLENKIEVGITEKDLTPDTAPLAKGASAVSTQQVSIREEEIYRTLSEYGVAAIGVRSTGVDSLNKQYMKQYGILGANIKAYSPRSIAEFALTTSMMLIRNIPRLLKHEQDLNFSWNRMLGREVASLTVGVIGTGNIGFVTAQLFKALGANVIAYDKFRRTDADAFLSYRATVEDVAREADILSLHVPYSDDTRHMIDDRILKIMKPSAILVNAARGPVVDTAALISALRSGEIAGAALDSLEGEEMYANKTKEQQGEANRYIGDLLAMDNVVLSPHIAFFTLEAATAMVQTSLRDLRDIAATGKSTGLISLE